MSHPHFEFPVTQDHIRCGQQGEPGSCAVALGCSEYIKAHPELGLQTDVHIDSPYTYLYGLSSAPFAWDGKEYEYIASVGMSAWISSYDKDIDATPTVVVMHHGVMSLRTEFDAGPIEVVDVEGYDREVVG
jgi:hypothetical protein